MNFKMKNHYFILLFVLFHFILVNCDEEARLDIVVSIDDGRSSIEVFKSKVTDWVINGGKKHDIKKVFNGETNRYSNKI